MRRILRHPHFRMHVAQATKFIVCGLLGAVMDFSILYVLVTLNGVTPFVAYIFSAGIPGIFVFLFNRHVTFGAARGNTKAQSRRFIVVYSMTFCLNYALSSSFYALGSHYFVDDHWVAYGAKVLAIGITAFVNYSLSHYFIFKPAPVSHA